MKSYTVLLPDHPTLLEFIEKVLIDEFDATVDRGDILARAPRRAAGYATHAPPIARRHRGLAEKTQDAARTRNIVLAIENAPAYSKETVRRAAPTAMLQSKPGTRNSAHDDAPPCWISAPRRNGRRAGSGKRWRRVAAQKLRRRNPLPNGPNYRRRTNPHVSRPRWADVDDSPRCRQ